MTAHPRLSVNAVSSYGQSLQDDLDMWASLGVDYVALILPKILDAGWDRSAELVKAAGLRVSTMFGPTYRPLDAETRAEDRDLTVRCIEFAAEVGAETVYVCSGAAGSLDWEEASRRYGEVVAPSIELGARLGVPLLLEPTNPLRADISFVFWQRDAMDLARRTGQKVMLDLQSCWYERSIESLIRDNIDVVGLTQISDFRIGTTQTGDRVVPGDGDIPLERLLRAVVGAGFTGSFDLEVMGPRVEAEGYPSSVRRCVERASELLDRVGA